MNINQVIGHSILEMFGVFIIMIAFVYPISTASSLIPNFDSLVIVPFFGIAAAAMAYRVTGAQFNPIISLVNAFRKDKPDGFDLVTNLIYIGGQFIGAVLGGVFSWWWSKNTISVKPALGGDTGNDYELSELFGFTLFGSFVITLIYLMTTGKDTTATKDTGMQAAVVGVAHTAVVLFPYFGSVGGFLNPWIDLSATIYFFIDEDNKDDEWDYMWINLLVPWLGAAIAYAVHQFVLLPAAQKASRDPEAEGKIVENQA